MSLNDTHIPRRLLKYSDDETQREKSGRENLEKAERAYHARASRFTRYFGPILSGEQMTAAERLSNALETAHKAGNASPSYDGVSITSVAFGPKDGLTDHVLYAFDDIRRCRDALTLVLTPYKMFEILESALVNDLPPQELGDLVARQYRLSFGRVKRRELAVSLVETATKNIVPVFSKRG